MSDDPFLASQGPQRRGRFCSALAFAIFAVIHLFQIWANQATWAACAPQLFAQARFLAGVRGAGMRPVRTVGIWRKVRQGKGPVAVPLAQP